jgi:Skp family chaperone for outer membrane proteins
MGNSRTLLVAAAILLAGAIVLKDSRAQSGAPPAGAVGPAPAVRVAVCDRAEVLNNYLRARDLASQFKERAERIQGERDRRQQAIEAIKLRLEGLKKDSPQYEKDLSEMQRLTIDMSSWLQFQEALMYRENCRLGKEMYVEILKAIEKVAKERGVQLVMDRQRQEVEAETNDALRLQMERRKVLYCDEALDLTEAVLSRLNEAYRSTKPATRP